MLSIIYSSMGGLRSSIACLMLDRASSLQQTDREHNRAWLLKTGAECVCSFPEKRQLDSWDIADGRWFRCLHKIEKLEFAYERSK